MVKTVYQKITDLRNLYFQTRKLIQKKYNWKDDDARIGVFAKCMNVYEPVLYSLYFEKNYLRKPDFLHKFSKESPTSQEVKDTRMYYLMYQQYSFTILFFSAIECSFRIFVRAIDSKACDGGKSEFQPIYKFLLKKTKNQKHDSLLELCG